MKLSLLTVVAALFAAACGNALPPPADLGSNPVPSSTGTNDSVAVIGNDDGGGAPDASATPSSDGDASTSTSTSTTPPASICDPTMTLGVGTGVSGASGATLRFAGISKDELTIAWLDGGTLEIADRASPDAPFGAPESVSGDVAPDSVGVSSDGLEILAVAKDRTSFLVFARDSRGDAFTAGSTDDYEPVVDGLQPGETLGDPVFVHDEVAFVYSVFGGGSDTVEYALRISSFASFRPAGPLGFAELREEKGLRRHVTGAEDDLQTLFYWDEVSQTEKLAHTDGTGSILATVDLGAHPWAQASGTCARVYYGEAGLFFALPK